MKVYRVKAGQNLFDIAIQLYGSIEGIYDLLISNPDIGMITDLKEGDVIMYHDGWQLNPSIVSYLSDNHVVPSNGEYYTLPYNTIDEIPDAIIFLSEGSNKISMEISGDGICTVDWGDGNLIVPVLLTPISRKISHWYSKNTNVSEIRLYISGIIDTLKIKNGRGELRVLKPLTLHSYSNDSDITDSESKKLITIK